MAHYDTQNQNIVTTLHLIPHTHESTSMTSGPHTHSPSKNHATDSDNPSYPCKDQTSTILRLNLTTKCITLLSLARLVVCAIVDI